MKKQSISQISEQIAAPLAAIASPQRIAILLLIGKGEACVCHLEVVLGKRQAYISQHLMALRNANIITARREGRFIYYRLANPSLLTLIRDAGRITNVDITPPSSTATCSCPNCADLRPGLIQLTTKENYARTKATPAR
ncbi:MAG TPA: metalloregulator ArsR/SmtB family transcription factor [Anaerolineales bacterium]|nr:metalloregulator ArsR/SmtB family transcription factor [Anaerolineales bacterium]